MMHLAVMQGRLSPPENDRIQCFPRSSWREEFPRAADAGVPALEWIDDLHGEKDNPLRTATGIQEMQSLMERHGISIPSLCADSFIEEPLVRCSDAERGERIQLLRFLLGQAHTVGIQHVGIPFLDHSALKTADERAVAIHALENVLPDLEEHRIELHVETSLEPETFRLFLDQLPHPLIRVTYDTGNSAALGFDPREEFAAYGDRVGSVHIKDRVRGGGTVQLGTGNTDFAAVVRELRKLAFDGLFTLQAARGELGDEVNQIRTYREFAENIFGSL